MATPQVQLPNIGTWKDPAARQWASNLSVQLTSEFQKRLPKTEPVTNFLMRSPGGIIYRVIIDDAGALSTELVQG